MKERGKQIKMMKKRETTINNYEIEKNNEQ